LASEFIVATMSDKSGLKSIEQIAGHYEIAFDNWQIELNEPILMPLQDIRFRF